MERIAIISDIHGNITAFEAALADIRKRGIKRIFCLGDMVIKCPSPEKCVDLAFENCEIILKGNCEERSTTHMRIDEHNWNREHLREDQIERMVNLPVSQEFYMSGLKIRMMHASSKSFHQKGFFWDIDDGFNERMEVMFENTEFLGYPEDEEKPNVVIFGHIHRPLLMRIKDKMLVNPGAISNTSDIVNINGKDYTYGSYLIVEGEYDSKEVSSIDFNIVKFTYDNNLEAQRIQNSDMPFKDIAYEEIKNGTYFNRGLLDSKYDQNSEFG